MSSPFFNSKSARQGFLFLFFGFVLIFIAGLYVFTVFIDFSNLNVTPREVAKEVYRSIRLAKALPISVLPRHLKQLEGQTLSVSLSSKPLSDSRVLYTILPVTLAAIVRTDFANLKISVPLANGQWLNIERTSLPSPWFSAGFLSSVIVLLFALILLCYLVIKRVTIPVGEFTEAAKRFGMDLQAPPLAIAGSPETQVAVKSFNEMQRHIRRMVHDRSQMLAAVSHDLRTPITRLQLRMEYFKGTPQYEKAIADLAAMEQMISSILAFARDHARSETMERFDVNALLSSLCDDMVDMGRRVTYTSDVERQTYFGRMNSLRRAITNFVDNAIKYGDQASVSLAVKHSELQIKIEDHGPGIPENQLEKVFDPFYRVDPARSPKTAGTGLGMTVAREIIRNHGGDVMLMNRKEGGLLVSINLPLTTKSSA